MPRFLPGICSIDKEVVRRNDTLLFFLWTCTCRRLCTGICCVRERRGGPETAKENERPRHHWYGVARADFFRHLAAFFSLCGGFELLRFAPAKSVTLGCFCLLSFVACCRVLLSNLLSITAFPKGEQTNQNSKQQQHAHTHTHARTTKQKQKINNNRQ